MKYPFYLGFASVLLFVTTAQAQWFAHVDANYEYNDNLSNAQLSSDIKSDSAFRAKVSPGKYFQLGDSTGLSLNADVGGATYLRFNGLNHVFYGGSTSLKHKFGLGEFAPWVSASGSVAHYDFENNQRTGWRYNAGFSLGKRLTERWEVQVKYGYENRISDHVVNIAGLTTYTYEEEDEEHHDEEHEDEEYYPPLYGDAFNIEAHSVSFTNIFTVADSITAYLGYTRREGGVTSTTLRNVDVFNVSDAVAVDSAFGPDRYAYKIDAGTDIVSTGMSWALTGDASLNMGYEWVNANAAHGIHYTNHIGHLNLLYNF